MPEIKIYYESDYNEEEKCWQVFRVERHPDNRREYIPLYDGLIESLANRLAYMLSETQKFRTEHE